MIQKRDFRSWSLELFWILFFGTWIFFQTPASAAQPHAVQSPYAKWSKGPPTNENYFPIAVWLQNPSNAERFKAAGINLYVGLYRGPTTNQLDLLQKAGISVICGQGRGLQFKDHPIIVGWM